VEPTQLDLTERNSPLSGDRNYLFLLDPSEYVTPEDGDRIQSLKRRVFK
jgi:hypothetical protein